MIFGLIKNFLSIGSVAIKIIKIIACVILIWLAFNYLNNKIGIMKPFISIVEILFKGIKSTLSTIGIG